MNKERMEKISNALVLLMEHNLWRKGFIESQPVSPEMLGKSIETACGALIDFMADSSVIEQTKHSLEISENSNRYLQREILFIQHEVERVKRILKEHHISSKEVVIVNRAKTMCSSCKFRHASAVYTGRKFYCEKYHKVFSASYKVKECGYFCKNDVK